MTEAEYLDLGAAAFDGPPSTRELHQFVSHGHPSQKTPPCTYGSIVGIDPETGQVIIIPVTCHRWECEYCAPRRASRIYAQILEGDPERHLMLTCRHDPGTTPLQMLDLMKDNIRRLAYLLRQGHKRKDGKYTWGPYKFEYACLWELHRDGFPHAHLATWGDYLPHSIIRMLWRKLTGATYLWIKGYANSFIGGHHWTKYILKQLGKAQSLYRGSRLVSFSQGYARYKKNPPDPDKYAAFHWHHTHMLPGDIAEALVLWHSGISVEADPWRCSILVPPHTLSGSLPNLDFAVNQPARFKKREAPDEPPVRAPSEGAPTPRELWDPPF